MLVFWETRESCLVAVVVSLQLQLGGVVPTCSNFNFLANWQLVGVIVSLLFQLKRWARESLAKDDGASGGWPSVACSEPKRKQEGGNSNRWQLVSDSESARSISEVEPEAKHAEVGCGAAQGLKGVFVIG